MLLCVPTRRRDSFLTVGFGLTGSGDHGAGFLLGQDFGQQLPELLADGGLTGKGPEGVLQLAPVAR